ncbi:MAG: hypothetical protein KC800_25595 [Candidatus Eremiobacteraeota bacterium]|nr:hypothetical protein [Candidatus Eremiobacteraeota bacterium]
MTDDPRANLARVPSYIQSGRLEEAERLLISVLRDAEEESDTYWEGLLTLTELYERQERYREALILSREVPDKLSPDSELGKRGRRLRARLHEAEGEDDLARDCLRSLGLWS